MTQVVGKIERERGTKWRDISVRCHGHRQRVGRWLICLQHSSLLVYLSPEIVRLIKAGWPSLVAGWLLLLLTVTASRALSSRVESWSWPIFTSQFSSGSHGVKISGTWERSQSTPHHTAMITTILLGEVSRHITHTVFYFIVIFLKFTTWDLFIITINLFISCFFISQLTLH